MPKLLPRLRSTSFNPGPLNVLRPSVPPLAHPRQTGGVGCCPGGGGGGVENRVHGGSGKSAAVANPLRKSDRLVCLEFPNDGMSGTSGPAPSPLRSWPAVTHNG